VPDYQGADKWLDQVYMAAFLVVAMRWHGPPRSIAIGLYVYRLVGFVAFELTGDHRWADGLDRAIGWFLGDNDSQLALYDATTGGGCDALTPHGRNTNQGAESTLAMVSTLQHAADRSRRGRRLSSVGA